MKNAEGFVTLENKKSKALDTFNIQMESVPCATNTNNNIDNNINDEEKKVEKFDDDLDQFLKRNYELMEKNELQSKGDESLSSEPAKEESVAGSDEKFADKPSDLVDFDKNGEDINKISKVMLNECVDNDTIKLINIIQSKKSALISLNKDPIKLIALSTYNEKSISIAVVPSKAQLERWLNTFNSYNIQAAELAFYKIDLIEKVNNEQIKVLLCTHQNLEASFKIITEIDKNVNRFIAVGYGAEDLSILKYLHDSFANKQIVCIWPAHIAQHVKQDIKLYTNNTIYYRQSLFPINIRHQIYQKTSAFSYPAYINNCFKDEYGVIFSPNFKRCQEINNQLFNAKIPAAILSYKSNLENIESQWHSGQLKVLVCNSNSIKFGIRSDVKFIIHDILPTSIETYIMQSLYSGLNDKPATNIILYQFTDRHGYDEDADSNSLDEKKHMLYLMINYCEEQCKCRMAQLQKAIGEKEVICNVCDVCTHIKQTNTTNYNKEAIDMCTYIDEINHTPNKITLSKLAKQLLGNKIKGVAYVPHPTLSKLGEKIIQRIAIQLLCNKILYEIDVQYEKASGHKFYTLKVDPTYLRLLLSNAISIDILSYIDTPAIKKVVKPVNESRPIRPQPTEFIPAETYILPKPEKLLRIEESEKLNYTLTNENSINEIKKRLEIVKEFGMAENKQYAAIMEEIFDIGSIINTIHALPSSISDLRMILQLTQWNEEYEIAFCKIAYMFINEIKHFLKYKNDHSPDKQPVQMFETHIAKRKYENISKGGFL